MAQNDFLVWAGSSNANVLTQAAYAALTNETTGVSAGRASGQQFNKTLRQATIFASALGSLINNLTGDNAVDDGTTAAIITSLTKALRNPALYVTDTGTASNIVASLNPAPPNLTSLIGVPIKVKVAATSTGASGANINGFGVRTIVNGDGSALGPGAMVAGGIAHIVFDGTNFELLNPQVPSPQWRLAHGECRFVSNPSAAATQVMLRAWNGSNILVNGVQRQIPVGLSPVAIVAGFTGIRYNGVDNQNIPINTLCYVAVYADNTGTPRLAFFNATSYGHGPDSTPGNVGVEVITQGGNVLSQYTLVGQVYINNTGQVSYSTSISVISWFNRHLLNCGTDLGVPVSSSSQTWTEIDGSLRAYFCHWVDESVTMMAGGEFFNSGNFSSTVGVALDSSTTGGFAASLYEDNPNSGKPWSSGLNFGPPTGSVSENAIHYGTIMTEVDGGSVELLSCGLYVNTMG